MRALILLAALAILVACGVYLRLRHLRAERIFSAWERSLHRNPVNHCARCGCQITPENDSGWDVFVAPSVVQRECQVCHDDPRYSAAGQKPHER